MPGFSSFIRTRYRPSCPVEGPHYLEGAHTLAEVVMSRTDG